MFLRWPWQLSGLSCCHPRFHNHQQRRSLASLAGCDSLPRNTCIPVNPQILSVSPQHSFQWTIWMQTENHHTHRQGPAGIQDWLLYENMQSKENNHLQMQPTQLQYLEPFWKQTFYNFEYSTPNPYLELYCVIKLKGQRWLPIWNSSRSDSLALNWCIPPLGFCRTLCKAHLKRAADRAQSAHPLQFFWDLYSTWDDILSRSEQGGWLGTYRQQPDGN